MLKMFFFFDKISIISLLNNLHIILDGYIVLLNNLKKSISAFVGSTYVVLLYLYIYTKFDDNREEMMTYGFLIFCRKVFYNIQ